MNRDVTELEPLAVVLLAYFCGLAMRSRAGEPGWWSVAVYLFAVGILAACSWRAAGWNVGRRSSGGGRG